MYFQLTEAVKRRIIEELRRYWSYHPKYRDNLVHNIQGKFSFNERPQYGIIVKTSGANRVDLSADNFIGTVSSYCLLTKVREKNGLAIEWIREDSVAIQNNGGKFPSAPGVYYIDIVDPDPTPGCAEQQCVAAAGNIGAKLVFYVDPLLNAFHEQVMMSDTSHGQLLHKPTQYMRLYEMPSGIRLEEGINYTFDKDAQGELTGGITLAKPLDANRWLEADYRYQAPSLGPFALIERHANHTAIPGVVMVFGRKAEAGDQMAIVVQNIRKPAYLEYGGRWELTLECEVMARDVYSQNEIADETVIYLWGVLRSRLASSGLNITDVSLGGESEEIYDENGDDYFYNSSFSITVETEWSIHVPLDKTLRSAIPLTRDQQKELAGKTDDELKGEEGNIKIYEQLGIDVIRDPFWSGRRGTFEMIK